MEEENAELVWEVHPDGTLTASVETLDSHGRIDRAAGTGIDDIVRAGHKGATCMRGHFLRLTAIALLAGCTNAEKGAVIGGVGGAAVGGLVTGDVGGAAVGGGIGAVGGYLIGRSQDRDGYCRYRDRNGRIYEDRC